MAEPRYGRTWEVRLPWTKPPLSLNDRGHWRKRAGDTAKARKQAFGVVNRELPLRIASDRIDVTLTYVPRDNRRRDADNLVATLKVCCDALVDAAVVHDDTPALMVKHMPVILPPDGDPRLVLVIREVLS